MTQSLWVVIPAGVLLLAFILFAFRQGLQVTGKPRGTPPEETANYTVSRDD
jgi:hypothetical protein